MAKEMSKLKGVPVMQVMRMGSTANGEPLSAASEAPLPASSGPANSERRRATSIVAELSGKYGIAANRLDAFGCGIYSPVASNEAEVGRAKNRRVELVQR
jgi:flagellar motor protein MotB